jgi:CubicO group peptidase (beta-lactamase class C family)
LFVVIKLFVLLRNTYSLMELSKWLLVNIIAFMFFSCSGDYTQANRSKINYDSISEASIKHKNYSLLQLYLDSVYAVKVIEIDDYFTRKHEWSGFNGNVLFAVKGKVIYQKAFGYRDLKKKEPLVLDDAFQLASVSKTITSTAILQLYEKGLLSLDDTIQQFIPDFPEKYKGVTIDYLLSHKSGLFEYWHFNDEEWRKGVHFLTYDKLFKAIKEKQPGVNYLPGKRYNYNNLNFVLLARIVEIVSKQSFAEYLQSHIFVPAKMNNSFVFDANDSSTIKRKKVIGHYYGTRKYKLEYPDGLYGDKGVFASVGDLLQFDQSLLNGTLLRDTTLVLATTKKHARLHEWDNYGYGWRVDVSPDRPKLVYHSGWWKGFKTKFIRIGDNEGTIIILSNRMKAANFSKSTLVDMLLGPPD